MSNSNTSIKIMRKSYARYFRLANFGNYLIQKVTKEGYAHYVSEIMLQSSSVADFKRKLIAGGMIPGSLDILYREWNKTRSK